MRFAFAGTPEFARRALVALADAGHELVLVLTQPDRPAGRGMKLQPSPVKVEAERRGVAVIQPRSLRLDGRWPDDAAAARHALVEARPEVVVVAAYGLILPDWTLHCAPHGCVNIHASLLPRWRGAAPIQRAIEAGDETTGITLMQMEAGLDTGPTLARAEVAIGSGENAAELTTRLADAGARLVVEWLPRWVRGEVRPRPQPDHGVTYAAKIDKAEAPIDWNDSAVAIERRVRAFDPFPGAVFTVDGETVKLWKAAAVAGQGRAGEVLPAGPGTLRVACGEGSLELLEVQREGGRRVAVADFLRGHPVAAGRMLGGRAAQAA